MMTAQRNQGGFTLIELLIVVLIIGILAAFAFPQFLRYQAKTRQAEVKANLGGIYIAQRAFYSEFLRFGGFDQIGFSIAGTTNGYTYRSVSTSVTGAPSPQPGDIINPATGPATADNSTYAAASSLTEFTATATGNIDNDLILDEWYVNDQKQGVDQPTSDDSYL